MECTSWYNIVDPKTGIRALVKKMIGLIDLLVSTNEELNIALRRIENILGPLSQYITMENRRNKDIVKNKKALWLIQLKKYLKNKSHHIRRWEQYHRSYNK